MREIELEDAEASRSGLLGPPGPVRVQPEWLLRTPHETDGNEELMTVA